MWNSLKKMLETPRVRDSVRLVLTSAPPPVVAETVPSPERPAPKADSRSRS